MDISFIYILNFYLNANMPGLKGDKCQFCKCMVNLLGHLELYMRCKSMPVEPDADVSDSASIQPTKCN